MATDAALLAIDMQVGALFFWLPLPASTMPAVVAGPNTMRGGSR
jgi:hypothetical protein